MNLPVLDTGILIVVEEVRLAYSILVSAHLGIIGF